MPIKQYRPTSPGRRGMSVSTFEEITKTRPEKSLTVKLQKKKRLVFTERVILSGFCVLDNVPAISIATRARCATLFDESSNCRR